MEEANSTKSSKRVYNEEKESSESDEILERIASAVVLVGMRDLEEVKSEHCVMPMCGLSQISSSIGGGNDCDKTNLIDSTWFTKQNEIAFFSVLFIGVVMYLTS